MSSSDREPETPAEATTDERRPYEAPRIVWREPYEPVAFGISCAKQPGLHQCQGGPGTT